MLAGNSGRDAAGKNGLTSVQCCFSSGRACAVECLRLVCKAERRAMRDCQRETDCHAACHAAGWCQEVAASRISRRQLSSLRVGLHLISLHQCQIGRGVPQLPSAECLRRQWLRIDDIGPQQLMFVFEGKQRSIAKGCSECLTNLRDALWRFDAFFEQVHSGVMVLRVVALRLGTIWRVLTARFAEAI